MQVVFSENSNFMLSDSVFCFHIGLKISIPFFDCLDGGLQVLFFDAKKLFKPWYIWYLSGKCLIFFTAINVAQHIIFQYTVVRDAECL